MPVFLLSQISKRTITNCYAQLKLAPNYPELGLHLRMRLIKWQKRSAFYDRLTETKEEVKVHVWPCNTNSSAPVRALNDEEQLPATTEFFEAEMV